MTNVLLGLNLNGPGSTSNPELPFLNFIKMGLQLWGNPVSGGTRSFQTGSSVFDLDGQGYPLTMDVVGEPGNVFTTIWVMLFDDNTTNATGQQSSPLGTYIFLYDGGSVGTAFDFSFGNFVKKTTGNGFNAATSNGRIVLDNPNWSGGQDRIQITALGTTRPVNWRLVYEPNWTFTQALGGINGPAYDPTGSQPSYVGTREWSLMHDNEVLNPDFIDEVKQFKVMRFMDFYNTNNNRQTVITPGIAGGTIPTDNIFYNDLRYNQGVPYEFQVALCNKIYSLNSGFVGGWFNMPMFADNAYVAAARDIISGGSGPDAYGKTWAGYNAGIPYVIVEQCNEIWNNGFHSTTYNQLIPSALQGIVNFPGMADLQANFNGFIDDGTGTGTIPTKNPSGVAGTVLTVNVINTGSLRFGGDLNNMLSDAGSVTNGNYVTAQTSGSAGLAGSYTVHTSQNTGALTNIKQGVPNDIFKYQQYWRGVNNRYIFQSTFGSRTKAVLGGQQQTDGNGLLQIVPTAFGGAATWDGTHSGTYAQNMDYFSITAYYDFNGHPPPAAWTDPATDSSYQKFKQEMISGGVLPLSSSFVTATTLAGGALGAGWTQCKVTSPSGTLPDPPPNGTIVCVKFTASSGASPTIAVDGGSNQPIQDNITGNASTVGTTTTNLIWTDTILTGAVGTPGWRTFITGYSNAGNTGFLAKSTYEYTKLAFDGAHSFGSDIPVIYYEGAPAFFNSVANPISGYWFTYLTNLHRSQAMGDTVAALLSQIAALPYLTGGLFAYFASCNFYTGNGNWGAKEFISDPPSPKYIALTNFLGEGGAGTGSGITTIHHGTGKHVGRPTKIPHI